MDRTHLLLRKFFEENSFIQSNIESYNKFIDAELQRTIDEIGDIIPTILPPEVQEFRIKLKQG
jgi:DNA-directed RNA polymerase beta subunit